MNFGKFSESVEKTDRITSSQNVFWIYCNFINRLYRVNA